jgi:phage repressor protein C with HTH and peptisase S24 domain
MAEISTTQGSHIRAARERMKLSQTALAEAVGTFQQTIEKIESGKVRHSRYIQPILEHLGLSSSGTAQAQPTRTGAFPHALIVGDRDLPVYGAAEGGGGVVIVSNEPVDTVLRPAPLASVRDAYGLIVAGDSMEPAYEPGDTILVHPHLPPVQNVDVVLYCEHQGEERAVIKRLLRFTSTTWYLRQHNPAPGEKRDFTLPRTTWNKCHRIVGKYSRR